MAMLLYSHDAQWKPLRVSAAASVADNYSKMGTAVGSDAVEAGGTSTIIVATAHSVAAKDFVMFYDGGEESEPRHAESVTTDLITLGDALSGAPSAGESFVYLTGDGVDAAEAGSTTTTINATAHSVTAGDMVWFVDGDETAEPRVVASVNANDLTLDTALSGSPSAAEEFAYATPGTLNAAVEAGTTDTIITDADNVAAVGDIFCMTSGDELAEFRVVISVGSGTFTLNEALSGTPTAAETYSLWTPDGTDSAEAGASTTRVIATAHAAAVGDELIMTNGDEDGEAREVTAIGTDYFDLEAALSGTPTAAETFNLIRPVQSDASNSGRLLLIKSSLDQPVHISFNGSTDQIYLEAGDDIVLDLKSNNLHVPRSGYIYVKTVSTAPTSGSVFISEAY